MIAYCCHDLIFATKIRSTCDALGVLSRPVRDGEMLQRRLERVDDGKANEPVSALMIDLDTGDAGLALIQQTKAFDANLPVIAFGSHVATELLKSARDQGADFVMPRSAFSASLPDLLERFAGRE